MKQTLALLSALLLSTAWANAGIICVDCHDGNDGVIDCITNWDGLENDSTVMIDGVHNWVSAEGLAGHIITDVTVDDDPRRTLMQSIDNDTLFAWTGYDITVTMGVNFTIDNVSVTVPAGWTYAIMQPAQIGSDYVGSISYTGTAPVGIGDTLEFGYRVTFTGSVSILQEMTPTPEPASLAVLALGGLTALRRRG